MAFNILRGLEIIIGAGLVVCSILTVGATVAFAILVSLHSLFVTVPLVLITSWLSYLTLKEK